MNRDYLDHTIVKISLNTEKSPGDLRKLAVNQTPVKYDQITLVWRTHRVELQIDSPIQARKP